MEDGPLIEREDVTTIMLMLADIRVDVRRTADALEGLGGDEDDDAPDG